MRNYRAIRAIMAKDFRQVTQNKMVWLPMIILPLILQVLIPLGLVLMPQFLPAEELDMEDLDMMLKVMPASLSSAFEGLNGAQMWVVLSANYMFAPMFLIVPLMVSSIIAADSFVGERERKTLEALLYTPVSDADLFLAKVLSAFVPALAVTIGSFILYGLVVNLGGYPVMGRIFFPAPVWWVLVFWLAPAVSLAGLGATVLISAKAKTFMQAQQASGILVLPITFLLIGQVSGLFFLSTGLALVVGVFLWALGLWLMWVGAHSFTRSELISRV
jgi:ABC-type Na+ efflux pump permease subunit